MTTETTVNVGDRVKLTTSIYDQGEDHHHPGWLAMKGEILVVRRVIGGATEQIAVSHEDVTDSTFRICRGEYEPHNADGKPTARQGRSD